MGLTNREYVCRGDKAAGASPCREQGIADGLDNAPRQRKDFATKKQHLMPCVPAGLELLLARGIHRRVLKFRRVESHECLFSQV